MMESPIVQIPASRPRLRYQAESIAIGLIVLGYLVACILMPFPHNFSSYDDWDYLHAVERIVAGHGYTPPPSAQMTFVFHAYWGALFGALFGPSFTAVTAAVMTLSFIASTSFYALLRRLSFTPHVSLLGVAIFSGNYLFITNSYSFQTDITFVALTMLTVLCYTEGLRSQNLGWLAAGSMFAACAFLTRQFGLAYPLAAILWLLYTRKFRWGPALTIVVAPVLVGIGYTIYHVGLPPTLGDSMTRDILPNLLRHPQVWLDRGSYVAYEALPALGLCFPLIGRVKHWRITLVVSLLFGLETFRKIHGILSSQAADPAIDPATAQNAPRTIALSIVWCLGAILSIWVIAALLEWGWPYLRDLRRRRQDLSPAYFLFGVAVILGLGMFVASREFYDRYLLPLSPFIIAALLAHCASLPTRLRPLLWLAPAFVISLAIATHVDEFNLTALEWQAGRDLVAQGVAYTQLDNGYPWNSYFLYDSALHQLGTTDAQKIGTADVTHLIIDPQYVIDTRIHRGYTVIRTLPFTSLLNGAKTYLLYVMRRT